MNEQTANEADELTPFERFEALTRRLLAIPKQELDEKRAEEKQRKASSASDEDSPTQDVALK